VSEGKAVVRRFNEEIIAKGNMALFRDLVSPDFVNHSAPPGTSKGPEGFAEFFTGMLHPAFSGIQVHIHDQIEEGDKVATRKTLEGTHIGVFLGQAPIGKRIAIRITDIVRIEEGRYAEHWGSADLHGTLLQISG
jgi:predicted ester cyclase